MRIALIATVGLLGLAGCDLISPPAERPDAPERTAAKADFVHSQTGDLSGYYMPAAAVGPADFRLVNLFIGQVPEFRAWEAGQRSATFAPVMLDFQTGGEIERVLPDSYSVSDDRVRMTGTSRNGTWISLDGRLDQGALSTARRNLGEGEDPALTATVTLNGRTSSGLKFAWSGGD